MTREEINAALSSSKSLNRRMAAKAIKKQKLQELSEDLFDAYVQEVKDARTWETQVEMILTLGVLDYKPSLSLIEPIVRLNNPHSAITYAAAQTYVRLQRQSLNDAGPVIELLKFGGLSVVHGALEPLADDKMLPSNEEVIELLALCWDVDKHKDRIGVESGYLDPRRSLVFASAAWDRQLISGFIYHCLETGDESVVDAVKKTHKWSKSKAPGHNQ